MSALDFEYPLFLYGLFALPAAALALWFFRRRRFRDTALFSPLEAPSLRARDQYFWRRNALALLAPGLLLLAAANPRRGVLQNSTDKESADIIFLLDISVSMLAADAAPNRLDASTAFAQKLVRNLQGDRIGLVFFAGDAFLRQPLSSDYGFLLQSLGDASPVLISNQGSDFEKAMETAARSFNDKDGGGRAVILISDGEQHRGDAPGRAKALADDGIKVYTLTAGRAEQAPIPVDRIGDSVVYKTDAFEKAVLTRANPQLMEQIAAAGGGLAFRLSEGETAQKRLVEELKSLRSGQSYFRSFMDFKSYYAWLAAPALLLLLAPLLPRRSFRLQTIFWILIAGISPGTAHAQKSHRQLLEGDRNYDRARYEKAEQNYRKAAELNYFDPKILFNLGNTFYQQGKWEEAEKRFRLSVNCAEAPEVQADAQYNLGNALLQSQKYGEAVKAYESSLRLSPGKADAKRNLQFAKNKWQEEKGKNQTPPSNPSAPSPPSQDNQAQSPAPSEQQPPSQSPPGEAPSPPGGPQPLSPKDAERELSQHAVEQSDRRSADKYRRRQSGGRSGQPEKDW